MFTNIEERIRACDRRHIAVIGDVIIDRWVHGYEAPSQDGCQKFVEENKTETHGGAGNAANCLRYWEVNVELCSTKRASTKTRFVDRSGKILFRHDHDVVAGNSVGEMIARRSALEWVGNMDGVLLSDYDKGFLTLELIHEVTELCRRRGVPCVVDLKRGLPVPSSAVTKGNEDWYTRHGDASVVTRGVLQPLVHHVPLCLYFPPVKCVNHVGAGDCFSAHLLLGLVFGLSLERSAALGHAAGRVYVQHPHNRPPTPQEVVADLSSAKDLSTAT